MSFQITDVKSVKEVRTQTEANFLLANGGTLLSSASGCDYEGENWTTYNIGFTCSVEDQPSKPRPAMSVDPLVLANANKA